MKLSRLFPQHIRNYQLLVLVAAMISGGLLLFTYTMTSHAIEEPDYTVVQKLSEDIEIRDYGTYAVAEVVVEGEASGAGSKAFPILAGYIFGKNKGERKLEMTAPVTQTAQAAKLEMTAPVTQTKATDGYQVQFVLPKGVTTANAPEPTDERVMLREVAAKRVAAIQYSGFWSEANYNEHLEQLQTALRDAKLSTIGEPVYSRYNPPFTLWFLRRNEIWLQLAATQ